MCHFFSFLLIYFLKKFIFCHFCYKSCCRFLFVSVLFFFAYFLKNDVLPFLLEELLLIFCNNMIHIAELKNKCSFFIYLFLLFNRNELYFISYQINKSNIFFYFPSNYYFSAVISPYLFNYKNLTIF